jgi:hypothetical protein
VGSPKYFRADDKKQISEEKPLPFDEVVEI